MCMLYRVRLVQIRVSRMICLTRPFGSVATCLARWLPLLLISIHAGLLVYSLRLHSVVIDEAAHVPSGVAHWHTGKFADYRVNPPLGRMLATIPLLFNNCRWVGSKSTGDESLYSRHEWNIIREFQQSNSDNYYNIICLSRIAGVVWSCVGASIVFRWSRELYGRRGGLLSLAIWCFEPNIIAHAQIVTPDIPCTVAGLLATYSFWCYLRSPGWYASAAAGLSIGIALLTKFTLVAILPAFLLLLFIWRYRIPVFSTRLHCVLISTAHGAFAMALAMAVINMGYLFVDSFRPVGDISFISNTFSGVDSPPVGDNVLRGTWVGKFPSPFPADWLRGIDVQRRDFEKMHQSKPSYLAGVWQGRGWWYYYLYALAIKSPVGIIFLVCLGVALSVFRHKSASALRNELAFLVPCFFIIILVSSQTGFNHHMRYVLPALPYLYISAGKTAFFIHSQRILGLFVLVALFFSAASSLCVFPHSLSYFNELIGGPRYGHEYLVDSNIDWGQDVYFLDQWLDEHPAAQPMHFALFTADPDFQRRKIFHPLPCLPSMPPGLSGPRPGYYAISVNVLQGMETGDAPAGALVYFKHFEPVELIGYSIYIYRIELDECNAVRRRLGILPIQCQ